MSNSTKAQEQALKKLEDEAYFELCQIIAEAMQLEDVELLDARIAYWKTKYKKLLDRPSTSSKSDFKKRIEFLLNDYYSSITQYILDRLRLKEEKKIANQAKAMRELHNIIKNTNDYNLLKKKVSKWKEKYPVDSFLRMYQKRIELYTRDKNLRENAFKQEEAFSDLVDITKKYATLDELNVMITDWEKKYSINDKYSIDDFLKHQSEVKRFISEEFLQTIAREDRVLENEKLKIDVNAEYNNKSFSNLSAQASSYSALLAISKSPNNVDEMFKWVYKNRYVKFNDKYKELILSATYLEYSPTYLNKLPLPDMDITKSSLSFDEYQHIDDIKRYAILSYFNLLLPPNKAISNNSFDKNIQSIYSKSEMAKTSTIEDVPTISSDEILKSGLEISLNVSNIDINSSDVHKTVETIDIPKINKPVELNELISSSEPIETNKSTKPPKQTEPIKNLFDSESISNLSLTENPKSKTQKEDNIQIEEKTKKVIEQSDDIVNIAPENTQETESSEQTMDYDSIVAFSPMFLSVVYNYNKQAEIINNIDETTTKYIGEQYKNQDLELITKQKLE